MKICISATGKTLKEPVDGRFGRCAYFLIVDSETMQFEVMPNNAADAVCGAGTQAVQVIAKKGIKTVITGNVGPNATKALSATGIEVVTGISGSVKEAIKKYLSEKLKQAYSAIVESHFGTDKERSKKW